MFKPSKAMQASIVIPSLNSPLIAKILGEIRKQTAISQVGEVIIVGKDQDNLIENDPLVHFIDTGNPVSASKARNIGLQVARYEVLLFLDSDCIPQQNWLYEHLKTHSQGHQVVGGGVLPKGTNYWSQSYNLTLFHEFLTTSPEGNRQYLPTLNLSVHCTVINMVGLMDEDLLRGQDIDWTSRMLSQGFQPYFSPKAAVFHNHNRTTFKKVWDDCKRSGYYMRQVRMQDSNELFAPVIIQSRFLLLAFSPIIALVVTIRVIAKKAFSLRENLTTIFAIYLTKIAWCWGASRSSDRKMK